MWRAVKDRKGVGQRRRPFFVPHLSRPPSQSTRRYRHSMNTPSDIRRLSLDGRDLILVGTAHISQTSIDTVRNIIAEEQPDRVCVQLDEQPYQTIMDSARWQTLMLVQEIRNGQASFLLANLALVGFQKRMGLR